MFGAGLASVDITVDNQASYDAGFDAGAESVECEECDPDAGYDEGFGARVASVDVGDANLDGTLDVLDIVVFIEIILNP